ncbi:MAG: TIGR01777 family protein [Actinobacteria bacterium]|nr:TIGR01777 family protein [Actinomycetota bacterium]
MDVVIAGGSGFIGSALRRSFEADGHRVIRMVRPDSKGSGPAGSSGDTIAWDPAEARIDALGLEGVDAVVSLGGVGIGDKKWSDERKDEILQSRLTTTSLLSGALAALQKPPAVFVTSSAVGYYGNRGDEELTEDSGPGQGFLSDVCVAWEDAARPAAEAGLRVAWIRTGLVLHPSGGVLKQLLLPFKLGAGGRLGKGTQYMPWITLDDEVGAIRRIIDDASMGGPVNLTAPNPVTNAEFTATMGKVLGRPTAIPTPLLPLKLRYGGELVQSLLLEGQRVLPAKLEEAGYAFGHTELEIALRTMLGKEQVAA